MPRYLVQGMHRLELADREDACLLNGVRRPISEVSGAIVKALLKAHPLYVSRAALAAILAGHNRSAEGINKAILDLKAELAAMDLEPLTESIRSRGYRVASRWEVRDVVSSDSQVSEALEELRQLCTECIEGVGRLRYVDSISGVQHVTPRAGQATTNYTRFYEAGWRLLMALSVMPTASSSLILELKQQLHKLESYVTYWRLATRHQEHEWKEEYRLELEVVMGTVELLTTWVLQGNVHARLRANPYEVAA